MAFIKSTQSNGEVVNLYYEDLGKGKNVLFIHGWPLSGAMWEYQITQLPQQGLRCITYDRRGFGHSDKPVGPYDYNTLAADLKAVIDELNLEDVTLVGFSMGGGEIAKYFSLYGGAKVSKVVLISAVVPYMLKTEDNPDGVPQELFDEMGEKMTNDRPAFLEAFNKDFFGVSLLSHPVSDAFLQQSTNATMHASPIATLECAKSFSSTDFRADVVKINVPTLIIHGDADKTVPIEPTGNKSANLIPGAKYIIYEGAPHGLWFTEKERLNKDLVDFI